MRDLNKNYGIIYFAMSEIGQIFIIQHWCKPI